MFVSRNAIPNYYTILDLYSCVHPTFFCFPKYFHLGRIRPLFSSFQFRINQKPGLSTIVWSMCGIRCNRWLISEDVYMRQICYPRFHGFRSKQKNVQHLIFGVIFVDQVSNFTANKGHPFEGPKKRKNPTTKFQLSAELRPKSEGLNLSKGFIGAP